MKEPTVSQMKRVLLIAYYFPPDFAVGGQRIAKFARNLPTFGWEPTVLTIADRYREQLDKERVNDLGNTRVIKTVKVPKFTDLLMVIKRTVAVIFKNKKSENRSVFVDGKAGNSGNVQAETLMQKIKRYYISFSFFPDYERSWVIPAALKAMFEIKRRQHDCIITSSPPHSSHIIGLIIKKLINVGWVADFRDPWMDILPYRAPYIRSTLSDRIESWIEGQVVRNANRILTTTNEHRIKLMGRFPSEAVDKFVYVSNGIDIKKFQTESLPERYATFTISYAGTIYLNRSPEPLFKAIQKLINAKKIEISTINFKLFGVFESIEGKTVFELARDYGIESIVEISAPIPLNEAIHVMKRSHLLLLLVTPIQSINIPAKIYDYFGSRTKILAITEPGATAELINTTNTGACFIPCDIDGIAEYIYSQCQNKNRDHVRNDPKQYTQFDTEVLTEKLSMTLSQLQTPM